MRKNRRKKSLPRKNPSTNALHAEKLFGTQQNTGDTENPDRAAERAAAAKVLFDKYNKTNEEKPADPSPYPDPYMIFDKYSNPGKPQEINIQYDPKEVFSKYGEQDKKPEKRYDPKEIFDKYNGKAPVEQTRGKNISIRRKFSINIIPKEPSRPNPKNITIRKTSSISTTKRKNPRQKKARASISNARRCSRLFVQFPSERRHRELSRRVFWAS